MTAMIEMMLVTVAVTMRMMMVLMGRKVMAVMMVVVRMGMIS